MTTKKVGPHLEKENAANPGGTNLPEEFPTSSLRGAKQFPKPSSSVLLSCYPGAQEPEDHAQVPLLWYSCRMDIFC